MTARRHTRSRLVAVASCASLLWLSSLLAAQSGALTREEALASVFPGADLKAERLFLTPEQRQAAADLAGVDLETVLVARYVARRDGKVVGRAYVDTHVVRTRAESLLISLDSEGRVRRVEATAFLEPREYQAPEAWLDQYGGRAIGAELELQRSIRPIAGATLTARAVNAAVRRVLALDEVLEARTDAP